MHRSPESIADEIVARYGAPGHFNRPLASSIALQIRRELSDAHIFWLNIVTQRIEEIGADPRELELAKGFKIAELSALAEQVRKRVSRVMEQIKPVK